MNEYEELAISQKQARAQIGLLVEASNAFVEKILEIQHTPNVLPDTLAKIRKFAPHINEFAGELSTIREALETDLAMLNFPPRKDGKLYLPKGR